MAERVGAGHLETTRETFGNLSGSTVIGRITVRQERNNARAVETSVRESRYKARTIVDVIERQRQGVKLCLSWCAEKCRQTGTAIFRRHFRLAINAILRQQVDATRADISQLATSRRQTVVGNCRSR